MLTLTIDQQLRGATAAATASFLLGRVPLSLAAVKSLSIGLDVVHREAQLLSNCRVQWLVLTRGSLECPGKPPGLRGGTRAWEDHAGALPGVQRAVGQGSGMRDGCGQIRLRGKTWILRIYHLNVASISFLGCQKICTFSLLGFSGLWVKASYTVARGLWDMGPNSKTTVEMNWFSATGITVALWVV